MSLQKTGYRPRIIDAKIEEYLQLFGAVSIEGPKWCGKTWTALNHANSVIYIMDPANNYNNRTLARLNPTLILPGNVPRVIDEWQEVPGIWDAVRFDIDQNPERGKYILTGSVLPPSNSYMHSGTGRIATVHMRPMSLFESGDSTGLISFGTLLKNESFDPFMVELDLIRLIDITIRGGWPETLTLPIEKTYNVSKEYINSITKSEFFHEEKSKRNSHKLQKVIRSLARNNSTTVNISTLTADVEGLERIEQQEKDLNVSRHSIIEYIKDLKGIYVIEEIPAWNPEVRSTTIMRQAPKRIFVDPSLALAALGVERNKVLNDLKTFGFMFENLCLRDIAIYAGHHGGNIFHYRDNSGMEVDAVVETPDGAWSAFEIKLGEDKVESAAGTLLRLREKMVAKNAKHPACLAVITGGGIARRRNDGVYVLPIGCLKD